MTKLRIVDLAGSEKFVKFNMQDRTEEKKRINELISINKSLTALGHCIKLMGESKSHIPYRNSKITRILKDSIFGNSKIIMIINLSPSVSNENETTSSLQFAERLKKVKLEVRSKNTPVQGKIMNLKHELEVERLKRTELE